MSTDRALRISAGDQELTVEVVGDMARLGLEGRPAEDGEDGAGSTDGPAGVEVPARALVAALRAAWADAHDAGVFEPWRGDAYGDRYGYRDRDVYDRYRYGSGWDPRDDDLVTATGTATAIRPWSPSRPRGGRPTRHAAACRGSRRKR